MLGTQAMMVASYFSTGSIEEELFAHYGNSSRFFGFVFVFFGNIRLYFLQIFLSLYFTNQKSSVCFGIWFAINTYLRGKNFARRNLFQKSISRFWFIPEIAEFENIFRENFFLQKAPYSSITLFIRTEIKAIRIYNPH